MVRYRKGTGAASGFRSSAVCRWSGMCPAVQHGPQTKPLRRYSFAIRHVCSSFRTGEYPGRFGLRFFATTFGTECHPWDLPVGPDMWLGRVWPGN